MRNLYELWMEQSREFFKTADEHLKKTFVKDTTVNPEENIENIRAWLKLMKQNWKEAKHAQDADEQWQAMTTICSDAADMMLEEWIKLAREDKPVKSIQELYELWLRCCNDSYQQSMRIKQFQDTYGEFISTAFRFWNNAAPRN